MNGTLIYVIGPSGAGKDSIINGAKNFFINDDDVVFVQRVITRKTSQNEAHIYVTDEQFLFMEASGSFIFNWDAHGLRYGIPMSAKEDVIAGKTLIVNSSREYLPKARQIFPQLKVVNITAPENILRARLKKRGRENAGDIDQRLTRGKFVVDADVFTIDNSGDLKAAVYEFANYVIRLMAEKRVNAFCEKIKLYG